MLRAMDAPQALADLTEISSQVVDVAIIDADGSIMATTAADHGRAERFAAGIARLVEQADALREARGLPDLAQLEAATLEGSVFVVRRNGRMIARHDPAGSHGRPRLLRPEALPALDRGRRRCAPAEPEQPRGASRAATRKKTDAPA